uniref:Uncharacterized protein n=1 Tax=Tanacetum cinerariifolium TaxID=118510 RepID=A0A6L2NIJ6_TANCI|nr:hypothetical protein [Tanacetum cinerariifolium]
MHLRAPQQSLHRGPGNGVTTLRGVIIRNLGHPSCSESATTLAGKIVLQICQSMWQHRRVIFNLYAKTCEQTNKQSNQICTPTSSSPSSNALALHFVNSEAVSSHITITVWADSSLTSNSSLNLMLHDNRALVLSIESHIYFSKMRKVLSPQFWVIHRLTARMPQLPIIPGHTLLALPTATCRVVPPAALCPNVDDFSFTSDCSSLQTSNR